MLLREAFRLHIIFLRPGNAFGHHFAAWPELLGSDSMQRYAMEALMPAPLSSQSSPPRVQQPRRRSVPYTCKMRRVQGSPHPVFDIVTGEPFKQSAELTGEPIKMKA